MSVSQSAAESNNPSASANLIEACYQRIACEANLAMRPPLLLFIEISKLFLKILCGIQKTIMLRNNNNNSNNNNTNDTTFALSSS